MKLFLIVVLALFIATGCATNRIDWQSRVGNYTYDETVLEMGPPENIARLSDGTQVGDWLTARGRSSGGSLFISRGYTVHHFPGAEGPDYYMRLTFDPQGRLTAAKRILK
jgi:hypothetical protein